MSLSESLVKFLVCTRTLKSHKIFHLFPNDLLKVIFNNLKRINLVYFNSHAITRKIYHNYDTFWLYNVTTTQYITHKKPISVENNELLIHIINFHETMGRNICFGVAKNIFNFFLIDNGHVGTPNFNC